jgi:hypothetical protein
MISTITAQGAAHVPQHVLISTSLSINEYFYIKVLELFFG